MFPTKYLETRTAKLAIKGHPANLLKRYNAWMSLNTLAIYLLVRVIDKLFMGARVAYFL